MQDIGITFPMVASTFELKYLRLPVAQFLKKYMSGTIASKPGIFLKALSVLYLSQL